MVVIRIRDHVARASSYEDGDVIYHLLVDALREEVSVDVSFDGISSVPSAFVNAAFVRLVERFPFEIIKSHVRFSESTKSINDLLRRRLTFAAEKASGASTRTGQ